MSCKDYYIVYNDSDGFPGGEVKVTCVSGEEAIIWRLKEILEDDQYELIAVGRIPS